VRVWRGGRRTADPNELSPLPLEALGNPVKASLGLISILLATALTADAAPPGRQRPHPAVVRVSVADGGGSYSMGSGTLVAVHGSRGLVVTNWHVVRDAKAPPVVIFPDGFRSAAVVARLDADWDLAALVIWRPRAEPVRISDHPPRPGEPLTIAGYGSGSYRMATGRCTQYVSPGGRHGFEMVELSAPARQGDSGGPIFNSRGELAGVLFGSAAGTTSGSFCGRVDLFLSPVIARLEQLEPATPETGVGQEEMIAARPTQPTGPNRPMGPNQPTGPVASIRAATPRAGQSPDASRAIAPDRLEVGHSPPGSTWREGSGMKTGASPAGSGQMPLARAQPNPGSAAPGVREATQLPADPAADSLLLDHMKTLLAGIGLLAIFAQIVRLLARAE